LQHFGRCGHSGSLLDKLEVKLQGVCHASCRITRGDFSSDESGHER
jgi:hypothetical protein